MCSVAETLGRVKGANGQGVPLGITTELASPPAGELVEWAGAAVAGQVAERRMGRYRLQNAAVKLLPGARVAGCMRSLLPGRASVAVMHSAAVGRAHFKGLMTCGSAWVCPVCASKISERRRVELSDALDRNSELTPVLVTFTLAHDRGDRLAELVDFLNDGLRRARSGAPWGRLRRRFGLVGSVSALEVTWGQAAGWHPHRHLLMFSTLRADGIDAEDLRARLTDRFGRMVARRGRYVSAIYGVDVRLGDGAVGNYLAKERWGLGAEVTKAGVKKARSGYSPWELLECYSKGAAWAGRLFVEYAAAMRGRSQLRWSAGLRDRLGVGVEVSDQELAEEEREPAIEVARLTWAEFKELVRQGRRAQLLAVADSGRADWVDVYLVAWGIRGVPALETVGGGENECRRG